MKRKRIKNHKAKSEISISQTGLLVKKHSIVNIPDLSKILPEQFIIRPSEADKGFKNSKSLILPSPKKFQTFSKMQTIKPSCKEKVDLPSDVKVINLQLPLLDKSKHFMKSFDMFKKNSILSTKNLLEAKLKNPFILPDLYVANSQPGHYKGCIFKFVQL